MGNTLTHTYIVKHIIERKNKKIYNCNNNYKKIYKIIENKKNTGTLKNKILI